MHFRRRSDTSASVSSVLSVLSKTTAVQPRFLDAFFRYPLSVLTDEAFESVFSSIPLAKSGKPTVCVSWPLVSYISSTWKSAL